MKKLLHALIVPVAVVGCWFAYAKLYSSPPIRGRVPVAHMPFDSAQIDRDIRSNEAAIATDPGAALNWSSVSSAYLVRSRESDDMATAVKAENAARKSLSIRKLGNNGAWNKLISALLQEHKFKAALSECEADEKAKLDTDDTILSHADCLIEIGKNDEADLLLKKHPRAVRNASGETVLARLMDVKGKPEAAMFLLRKAALEADQNSGMPGYAIAWFHCRLAMELTKNGKHDDARAEYQKALDLYPRDYKSMAGLAKLSAQEGRWQDVVTWGSKSDEVAQMADVRALVGDAFAMLGDPTRAEAQYEKVAALVGRPSGINDGLHEVASAAGTHGHRLDRQYALYCADHNRDPDGAYAAALRDFDAREDLYAYDTLAWVCLQMGNKAEAAKAIQKALVTGEKDPMLWYHAGVIFASVGEKAKASQFLHHALDLDARFDGIAAPKAQALLAQLAKQPEH